MNIECSSHVGTAREQAASRSSEKGRGMKRWTFTAVLSATAAMLTGCLTAHDVELRYVWDTEAAEELTTQRDVTETACGAMFDCVEALQADQGLFLKFPSEDSAAAAKQPNDEIVRGIFLMRWSENVPVEDREFVTFVLENALQSGKENPEALSMRSTLESDLGTARP